MYYSAGLLSKKDIYPEHKSSILKSEELRSGREKKEKLSNSKETKPIRRRKKKVKEDEKQPELVNVKIEPGTPGPSSLEPKDVSDMPQKSAAIIVKKEPVDFSENADFSFESDVDESGGFFGNVIETGSGLQSPSPGPSISPTPLVLHLILRLKGKRKKSE